MRILGLGGSHHDFCACLVQDGHVVSAVEEERLTRKKAAFGLGPRLQRCLAADYVLAESDLSLDDVDVIVANDLLNRVYSLRFNDRVTWIGHHLSHAASTFYTSPFERSAVLVLDGRGSETVRAGERFGETITAYTGDAAGLRVVRAQDGRLGTAARRLDDPYENSVGGMYEAVSKAIGFFTSGGMGAPGKTMGLAPYGTPKFVKAFAELYELDDGEFHQSTAQLQELRDLIAHELSCADSDQSAAEVRADVAYAVQAAAEHVVLELARWLHARTGERDLCLAGGVALNSVANFKILQETPFENVHIVPAAGDQGTALGAALYAHHVQKRSSWVPEPVFSPYLGRAYSEAEARSALAPHTGTLCVTRPDDLFAFVAQELANGSVTGWFQGRSEIGPRALGNRSILADPRRSDMKDRINSRVKHREAFRPFAPIVPQERQSEFFTSDVPAPYMLLVPDVRVDKREVVPAVTHVDGSARLQTVSARLNPRLHKLLTAFDAVTGVPVLLNTSFNDNEEPIVETPQDAVRCFLSTGMDLLVLGDLVVRKAAS